MKTKDEAISLAKKMISAGNAAGKITQAFITRMDEPLGRAIGNWLEIEQTNQILRNNIPEADVKDFLDLVLVLAAQSLINAGNVKSLEEGVEIAREKLLDGSALGKFMQMIDAQGGDVSVFAHKDKQPLCVYKKNVVSELSGFVTEIDALTLGQMSVKLGAGREGLEDVIDYCAGIILNKKNGDKVVAGETLFTIYTNKDMLHVKSNIIPKLLHAIKIVDSIQSPNYIVKPNVIDSFIDENGDIIEM